MTKRQWPEQLDIVVPCRPGKPGGELPIYGVIANDEHVFAKWWTCPFCGSLFHSRIACMKHMGIVSNVKESCDAR